MSKPGNYIAFLYDDAAVDVSRITGIPWAYEQVESRSSRRPCINLLELDWTDRMRVALTVIAVEYMLACYFNQPQLGDQDGTTRMDRGVAVSLSA